ncbi:MAG: PstS family phosphate ABC transporter substrate-binding protein [Cytophagales bacterium]|nr:PstS family phosphate ABC transporter substrate-binding protein [Cytophagales bacterium]
MRKLVLIPFLAVLFIACDSTKAPKTYTLKLRGSESMHETFNALKSDFEKMQDTLTIVLEGGGSRTGMMGVYENEVQVGLSSYPFDLDSILGNGHGLQEQVVAYDGIVLISHEDNPVQQLTNEQVFGIFSGNITDWSDLGGNVGKIVPIIRDQNSGTQQFFTNFFDIESPASSAIIAIENREIVNTVSENLSGIGFIGFAYFTQRVHNMLLPSPIEGDTPFVAPSFKNLLAGSYPLKRSLRIYYKDTNDPAINAFLSYLKTTRARYVIESNGLVPLQQKAIANQ